MFERNVGIVLIPLEPFFTWALGLLVPQFQFLKPLCWRMIKNLGSIVKIETCKLLLASIHSSDFRFEIVQTL